MDRDRSRAVSRQRASPVSALSAAVFVGGLLVGCGGGGTEVDSGTDKTLLSVEAADGDGDGLHYQWRVTAGSIDNRDVRATVWTLPPGPGLHFAYVMVSDGKGGYVEQQYAVATDAIDNPAPVSQPIAPLVPTIADFDGSTTRLRFIANEDTQFAPPSGGATEKRLVYPPDMPVQVIQQSSGQTLFSGLTDLSGEVDLPKLQSGETYAVLCSTAQDSPPASCGTFTAGNQAGVRTLSATLAPARNLRLYGHVAFEDGGLCGVENEYFGLERAATVQLQSSDGQALTSALRVNRFGDYILDASVPVKANLKLAVQCEAYRQTLDVPPSADPAGYVGTRPIELSHRIANRRPTIVKVVANGPEGNVRGRMIVAEPAVRSNLLPGAQHFLTFKGKDTKLSACMYYRSLGAVKGCDDQGNMLEPISLEDWKRQHRFKPYDSGNAEVSASYINKMDLNLVRRMNATQSGPQDIAFYVCNHPGPDGTTQAEVDKTLEDALADLRRVACVAMEWSATPGVNGGQPFTKFLTFGPAGALLSSVNLDGRGEKYMPGTCVACHGGAVHNGRFPEKGNPSPYLGSGFLPFDTGNYLFGSDAVLTEQAQGKALHDLNLLVRATETSNTTAVSRLIAGWYASGTDTLDKNYVPNAWVAADAKPATAGAARFYKEVVGTSCRTCHASLGATFDWDSTVLTPARSKTHVCGGTADLALNATMPNALISLDRVSERVAADPTLAALMRTFLGCETSLPDPVYPLR